MPKRREPKAFVSSTYVDLKKHRAHVIRALRKSGIHVDPMEDWTADEAEPKQFSQKRVEGCDLCILLVAYRRGYVPDGETLSITQMEYEYARQHGINVLVFLLEKNAPWPYDFTDFHTDPEIGKWREQLGKDHGVGTFGLDEQTLDVLPAVMRWKHSQTANADDTSGTEIACFDANKYGEALLLKFGRVSLDNVDVTGAYYDGVKLWDVFVPQTVRECHEYYPQVLEIPKEHQKRLREQGEWSDEELSTELMETRRRAYLKQPLRDVVELGDDTRLEHVVVLGDPGSGKSSLLRYLASRWARLDAVDQLDLPIPILIELRDYDNWSCSDGKSFHRYLSEAQTWYRIERTVMDSLAKEQGRVVLLLDGLDEIFDPARRKRVIDEIQRFALDFPQTRIVVTSRVIGYTPQALQDAEFRHFMLQDLEDEQVQTFLDRWHEETFTDAADRQRKQARLAKALAESRPIRELGGNPLLLTMMAILNRHEELPKYRAELYHQASKLLLHQWDTSRFRRSHTEPDDGFDYDDKAGMLRRVADHMQANREGLRGNIISSRDLKDLLAEYLRTQLGFDAQQARGYARSLIEQLRERNFVLCFLGAESYGFVHRTFLEYFCASAIVYRFKEEQSLTIGELIETIFGQHWHEEAWQEVLCLICGMIDVRFVAKIIEYLLAQEDKDYTFAHLFLAARCYGDVRNPGALRSERTNLREALLPMLEFEYPFYYEEEDETELADKRSNLYRETVRCLIQARLLDDARDWLTERVHSHSHDAIRCAAVRELAQEFQDEPDTIPILKKLIRSTRSNIVRRMAIQVFARRYQAQPDTWTTLTHCAESDGNYAVRQTAMCELARGFQDHPNMRSWLKRRAQSDSNYVVRHAAVQELTRGFRDDPDTLPWLEQCTNSEGDPAVRHAAIQELPRVFPNEVDAFPLLARCANFDENAGVRRAAAQTLARHFREHPDTPTLLKLLADSDESYEVRHAAVQELARGFKDDPNTLPWLKRCANSDTNYVVRHAAVQELARGFKDDPDTLAILIQRADSDDDGDVRLAALQQLAQGFKDVPDTLAILKQRANSDEKFAVRLAAIQQLARGFNDDPETLQLLTLFALHDDNPGVRRGAVRELVRSFKDEPDTLTTLIQIAQSCGSPAVRHAAMQELARGYKDNLEVQDILAYIRSAHF